MSEHIHVSTEGAITTVRFARPEKKNAITVAMYEGVTAALRAAHDDPAVRAVVITGAEGVFTAGNDLKDFMANPPTGESSAVFQLLLALVNFPKALIAAVDGPAVGIGTTLLLHCDFVVATARAMFKMPFVTLGLVPEGASSLLLPQRVGLQRASEWLLLAEGFDGDAAHRAGLVNAVVAPELLLASAYAYAEKAAAMPPEAFTLAKGLLRAPLREATLDALAREGACFVERLQSPETHAAILSFFTRR